MAEITDWRKVLPQFQSVSRTFSDEHGRVCTKCEEYKPWDEFYKEKPNRRAFNGRMSRCKSCILAAQKKRYVPHEGSAIILSQRNRPPRDLETDRQQKIAWAAKHRARKRETAVEPVNYDFIYRRDSGVCYLCGLEVDKRFAEYDHVVPLSRGGTHIYGNIKVTHQNCNRRKSDRLLEELAWL